MPVRKDFIGQAKCFECGASVGVYEDGNHALVYKCNGLVDENRLKCGAFHRFGQVNERELRDQINAAKQQSDTPPSENPSAPDTPDTPDGPTAEPTREPTSEPETVPDGRKPPSIGIAAILD